MVIVGKQGVPLDGYKTAEVLGQVETQASGYCHACQGKKGGGFPPSHNRACDKHKDSVMLVRVNRVNFITKTRATNTGIVLRL